MNLKDFQNSVFLDCFFSETLTVKTLCSAATTTPPILHPIANNLQRYVEWKVESL